ncbi:MAG: PAS domain S-box protein [Acidobacteria bacterium]|nr:PAS domain S-box protein [Acidobacteriota bacterium]
MIKSELRRSLLPTGVFVAISLLMAFVWWANISHRQQSVRVRTEITARQLSTRLQDFFATRMRVVDMFRMELESNRTTDEKSFSARSLQVQTQFPGMQALNWVDANGFITWVVPYEANKAALGHNLHTNKHPQVRQAISEATRLRTPTTTTPVGLVQGGMGVTCYFPVIVDGRLYGFLNGVFSVESVVKACLTPEITDHYSLLMKYDSTVVFEKSRPDASHPPVAKASFDVAGRTWQIFMSPLDKSLSGVTTTADLILLIAGFALAFVLAYLVRATIIHQNRRIDSEMKYRFLFHQANDGILVVEDMLVSDCNEQAERLFGCSRLELIGKAPFAMSPENQPSGEESTSIAESRLAKVRQGEAQVFVWLFRRADGSEFYADISLNAFKMEDRTFKVAIVRDVTQRRLSENAVRESEEKYRTLVENAHDAIFIAQDGCIKFPNPRALGMIGFSRAELLQMDVLDLVHPEDRKTVARNYINQIRGETPTGTYSFRIINRAAETLWVELSTVRINWEGKPGSLNFLRNITQQKDLENRLQEAQRLESVGTLAGGVAHDFNNLLMGIQGNISLIKHESNLPMALIARCSDIETLVQSGANLTRQLLGFARGGSYEVETIRINELVESTAKIFGRTRKEITIHEDYQAVRATDADKGQIERVLLNILVNAWQAMPEGGDIFIATYNRDLDARFCAPFNMDPGHYVCISIRDTGVGMEPSVQARIFEPFYTHRHQRRGTGLGLASAYGIIRAHGGIITVDSELGSGSEFCVFLPASEKSPVSTNEGMRGLVCGNGLILVVDDEQEVLQVTTDMLELLGYQVIRASNGREAVQIYRRHHDSIDLVMIDMIMPDMSGLDLFEALKAIDANAPTLLSSGYSVHDQAQRILEEGCLGFIQKPFRLETLSEKIKTVLDSRANQTK